jgi:hypothetical protein
MQRQVTAQQLRNTPSARRYAGVSWQIFQHEASPR